MKILTLMVLTLALAGCATTSDQRLVGTFVSDKDATVKYLLSTGKYNEKQLEVISGVLGRWKIVYEGSTVAAILDGETMGKVPLTVLDRTDEYVVVQGKFSGEITKAKLIFVDDGYWEISETAGPYYREKFTRVSKPPTSQ